MSDSERDFSPLIVVVGAAEGGLEALERLFAAVPVDIGMTLIVALHRGRTETMAAREIIARAIGTAVAEAADGMPVAANRVYVAPLEWDVTVAVGAFKLTQPTDPPEQRHPIDTLLSSISSEIKENAAAVILSGRGSNGTAGARAVRGSGGLVVAQDPASAGDPMMPRNVIDAGDADLVLAPEAIPSALAEFARRRAAAEHLPPDGQAGLERILALLRVQGGRDFRSYRKSTLSRRIARRMGLADGADIGEYLELLRRDAVELNALVADLMIGVTGFFRDPEAWIELDQLFVTPLLSESSGDEVVHRIWVPGCSTGEEAYSLAMLFLERAEMLGKRLELQIFATDVAEEKLVRARRGVYPGSVAADVGSNRLQRFFDPDEGDNYRLRPAVRETVTFAPHNLLTDPPFSRLDLISCRNLLIYLEARVQERLLSLFHFALNEGGCLLLGSAETIGRRADLFETVSKRWRIHRKLATGRREAVEFPITMGAKLLPARLGPRPEHRLDVRRVAQRVIAENFGPSAVLVDRQFRVLYIHGSVDQFLMQPAGEPTRDLLSMAREGLAAKLRATVRRAIGSNKRSGMHLRFPGDPDRLLRLTALPVELGDDVEGAILVSFHFETATELTRETRADTSQAASSEDELEAELHRIRAELQGTIEELGTSNEELQASNEEMASINEELQSANEELEASKEELQSLNEELATVNSQLHVKVDELERATDDLSNLLRSTQIVTIFLDPQFRIRWFTPSVNQLIDVIPRDIGRPLNSFALKFEDPDLLRDAAAVLRTLAPVERDVTAGSGRRYARRVLPYRTRDDRIDGVVMTFDDVTERRADERRQQFAREVDALTGPINSPERMLAAVVRLIGEHFGMQGALFGEIEGGERVVSLCSYRNDEEAGLQLGSLTELGDAASASLRRGEILALTDVRRDVRTAPMAKSLMRAGTTSLLAVPLQRSGQLIALLMAYDSAPRSWSKQDIELAELVAGRAWPTMERVRAERGRAAARRYAEAIVETIREPLMLLDGDLQVISVNRALERAFMVKPEELPCSLAELGGGEWNPPELLARLRAVQSEHTPLEEFELERDFAGRGRRAVSVNARALGGADGERRLTLVAIEDVTERKRAERERELLLRELRHRLKNSMAAVQAIAVKTLRRQGVGRTEWDGFIGRLEALGRVQDLLAQGDWTELPLQRIISDQLAPYDNGDGKLHVDGEELMLPARVAQPLSLAVHELATNAAKYGALSAPSGRVDVTWRRTQTSGGERLMLRWAESGGPTPGEPSHRGFGHQLIEQMTSFELNGDARLDFHAEGVRCWINIPLDLERAEAHLETSVVEPADG